MVSCCFFRFDTPSMLIPATKIAMRERKMPSDRFYRADMYPFHEGPEWIIMMHINPTLAR